MSLDFQRLEAYTLLEQTEIKELNAMGYLLEHKKNKAKIAVISNDDNNKVFNIGFRTPPESDTGLPHILEHSVLCGSKLFPAKDPFVELAKGSLNTFLNAMTYSDKTVYPVASCNQKDFRNLMHVYLDAVFYPNIYSKTEILRQEGWHYELNSKDDELIYNGVVYNEMKGVFSSPEQQLMRLIQKSLLKDTPYGFESGGDPACITDLTMEQFLAFHKKYYHPSNSYIYLYGDVDVEKELDFINKNYLDKFDYLEIDSSITMEKPYDKVQEITEYYSLSDSEEEKDNTYLSYNAIIGTSLDKELYLAFQIIEYILINVPGAPLKTTLIDNGIGEDVFSSYDNGILQPVFSIVAKNANEEDKEKFISIIRDTLEDIVNKGLNSRSIEAAINYFEFKYKEANFGRYPKGLMYGLQMFDSWLYDANKPFIHLMTEDTFEFLKAQKKTGYFEGLIKKYLLDNNHRSIVVVKPKKGLNKELEEKDKKKLAMYKASLSDSEIEKIIKDTKELKEYQSETSSKEDLMKIPLLSLEDIDKKARKIKNEEVSLSGVKIIKHNIFTNGIAYLKFTFDISDMPKKLVPYLSLLTNVLKYVDTENYSYNELADEINIQTGGIGFKTSVILIDEKKYIPTFEIRTKVLFNKISEALNLIEEILYSSHIEDKKRLREIIAETKAQLKMEFVSGGHVTAAQRAMSYFSEGLYFKEVTDGIDFYEFIEDLSKNFDERSDEIVSSLKAALGETLRKGGLIASYTGDNNMEKVLEVPFDKFVRKLSTRPEHECEEVYSVAIKNEGFMTASQVQYVATAGNFVNKGFKYTGALKVLQVIMSYDYLWNNVRVKGGAYGSMCTFTRVGNAYFTSYRDPNLIKTYDIYRNIPEFIKNYSVDDRDMLKNIIGAISSLDTPLTPSAEGEFSMDCYLSGVSDEDLQKNRDELLSTNQEKIRELAPLVKSVIDYDIICAIGDETKIENSKDSFMEVKNVF